MSHRAGAFLFTKPEDSQPGGTARSALHELDADIVGGRDVAQQATVEAAFQFDGKLDAFGAQLGAECGEIACVEKPEMIGAPFVVAGKPAKAANRRRVDGGLGRALAADDDGLAAQLHEDLRRSVGCRIVGNGGAEHVDVPLRGRLGIAADDVNMVEGKGGVAHHSARRSNVTRRPPDPGSSGRMDEVAPGASHLLMHFDHVAIGVVEENLVPAAHGPGTVIGIAHAFGVQMLLESDDVVGAKSNVAALEWIDRLILTETDGEVPLGQVHFRRAVGDEGDGAAIAARVVGDDPVRFALRLGSQIENVAIELVQRRDVGGAQIDVMQFEFHVCFCPLVVWLIEGL